MAENEPSSAETENTEGQQKHMIPKSRFDQVNEAYKTLQSELDSLKAKLTDDEKTRLAEQEEYRRLADLLKAENDALKPFKAEVETAKAALQETVDTIIEQIPEDMRELVPTYANPHETLAWLNKNAAKLQRPPAPAMDAGQRGDTSASKPIKLTPGQQQAARASGMTDEAYIAALLAMEGEKRRDT
jgi:chromosome segregation ATPase